MSNGGPAFPRPDDRAPDGTGIRERSDGMSLRDWFAGQALSGLLADNWSSENAVKEAYRAADAMLRARR